MRENRPGTATSIAFANIALIKYWGNRDDAFRLPMNGSISMNLDGLFTRTTVSFQASLPFDELIINGNEVAGAALERVSFILDLIRRTANIQERAEKPRLEELASKQSAGHRDSAGALRQDIFAAWTTRQPESHSGQRTPTRGQEKPCKQIT